MSLTTLSVKLRAWWTWLLLQGHSHHRGPYSGVFHQLSPLAVSLDPELGVARWSMYEVYLCVGAAESCVCVQVVCVCSGRWPLWRQCGSVLRDLWRGSQWGSASATAVHHGRCTVWGTAALQCWQCLYVQHFSHFTQVKLIFVTHLISSFLAK